MFPGRAKSGNVTDIADLLFVLLKNSHETDSLGGGGGGRFVCFLFGHFKHGGSPLPFVHCQQNRIIQSITVDGTQTFQSVGG